MNPLRRLNEHGCADNARLNTARLNNARLNNARLNNARPNVARLNTALNRLMPVSRAGAPSERSRAPDTSGP